MSTRNGVTAQRWTVLALVALLAAGNVVNALNKGGDFNTLLEAGRRVLAGAPLYDGAGVASGVTWPPFQGVVMVPFALLARIGPTPAKLTWHVVSCIALLLALFWWSAALRRPQREQGGAARESMLAPALLPLIAILLPLQTNFEHQNVNPVLLAITGAAALMLRRNRQVAGGVLVGIATALKAFPALLIVCLLAGRFWRATAAAIAAAAAATAAVAFFYGPGQVVPLVRSWLALNQQGGWPIRGNNQSLFAMFGRYFGREGIGATGHLWPASDPFPYWLAAAAAAALIVTLIVAVLRARPRPADAPVQMSAALAAAVLVSPIAWEHYWVLMFPAFYVLHHYATSRWHRVMFWVCVALVTGFSPVTVGAGGLAIARMLSAYTIAGIVLFVAVIGTHADPGGAQRTFTV